MNFYKRTGAHKIKHQIIIIIIVIIINNDLELMLWILGSRLLDQLSIVRFGQEQLKE